MIKRGTHVQINSTPIWVVDNLPEGARKARPLAVYDAAGNSLEIDSWEYQDGVLRVSFGIDPVVGELGYEYQTEGDDIVINGNGGVINVTINQNNSNPPQL